MCARFSLTSSASEIELFFESDFEAEVPPRANIAPTLEVPALVEGPKLKLLTWGMLPKWKGGTRQINARSETAIESPAFRDAMKTRRCIIPANGFYEWTDAPAADNQGSLDLGEPRPAKAVRQPYLFRRIDSDLLGSAAIWDRAKLPSGEFQDTFAILTTAPNELLAQYHDRMPCILERNEFRIWIDSAEPIDALRPMLEPLDADRMVAEPADRRLNNVRYEPYAA